MIPHLNKQLISHLRQRMRNHPISRIRILSRLWTAFHLNKQCLIQMRKLPLNQMIPQTLSQM